MKKRILFLSLVVLLVGGIFMSSFVLGDDWSCGDNFVDSRDDKTYGTVLLGTQCWMKQNMNYAVPNSKCYDNNQSKCNLRGRLYNGNQMLSACPAGWKLPTNQNFNALVIHLGDNAVNKLRWASGFAGLFAGEYRNDLIQFTAWDQRAYFRTIGSDDVFWFDNNSIHPSWSHYNVPAGFYSVRCISDGYHTCTNDGGSCSSGTGTCSGGICVPNQLINQSYWALLNGTPINVISPNSTVLMVFGGENLGGSNLSYVVQEFNPSAVWWNPLTWWSGKSWNSQLKIPGTNLGYQTYRLGGGEKYRFNASIDNTNIYRISGNLSVDTTISNVPPVAIIVSPGNNINWSTDHPLEFIQRSRDPDDLLWIRWDFGDNNTNATNNYSVYLAPLRGDRNYSYLNPGQYKVTLIAQEMIRGTRAVSSVNIRVFEPGVNVVPIISSPSLNEEIGYIANYNASQSYVVNCSVNESSIDPSDGFRAGNLRCVYLLKPGATAPINQSSGRVQVRWKEVLNLDPPFSGNNLVKRLCEGPSFPSCGGEDGLVWNSTNYNDIVDFFVISPVKGLRKIVLEMSYNQTI